MLKYSRNMGQSDRSLDTVLSEQYRREKSFPRYFCIETVLFIFSNEAYHREKTRNGLLTVFNYIFYVLAAIRVADIVAIRLRRSVLPCSCEGGVIFQKGLSL